jgi:hypothetical protein
MRANLRRTSVPPPELTVEPPGWTPSQGAIEALARLLRSLARQEQEQGADQKAVAQ